MVCVSTLFNIVLGVKNVVWSRGKAWGVYGRQFLLRFSNYDQNAYIFMYSFHKQFKIMQRVIIIYARRKKTIKKLVKHLKF